GEMTYQELADVFAVPRAVLRGAVRETATLREVRRHAVRRVEQSTAPRMHHLSLAGALAALADVAGPRFAAATALGLLALPAAVLAVKAVVDGVRRAHAGRHEAGPVPPVTGGERRPAGMADRVGALL